MSDRLTLFVGFSTLGFGLVSGCVLPRQVYTQLEDAESVIERAEASLALQCAPRELAEAQSAAEFARIELRMGDSRRADSHAEHALTMGEAALEKARPCAAVDSDRDTIADIIDLCPQEPEDFDDDRDEDGCPDVDPYGDEDGDGIRNIDDDCPTEAEDVDGHNDEDGCPETSEDSDGDGIIDDFDNCPTQAEDLDGFKDSDGCVDNDNDNDGVPDIHDRCINTPEDIDDWEDDDGCPDNDNDGDGVVDAEDDCPIQAGALDKAGCPSEDDDNDGVSNDIDRCPDERETPNGYLDSDGCADTPPSRVKVTRTRVEISDTIEFAIGSDDLLASAYPILDDVVKVMLDADWLKIRVEGHTDSQGDDGSNLSLSQDRAEAVMSYISSKGVEAQRLTALGHGETKPIDTNRTSSGRARNRRVEFHIVD